jgi:hypothetical protein
VINPLLFRKPVAIEAGAHRALRIKPASRDWSVASQLNAMFLATAEFGDACSDYPIVFVNAGNDAQGQRQVAPVAVFGLREQENLYVEDGRWRVPYIPALLQAYPFGIARLDDARVAVVMDQDFGGWSTTEGAALFDDQGQPSEYLAGMRDQLERVEAEIQRTRAFSRLLLDMDLLADMRFDATLAGGQKVSVEGFLAVDEKKLAALPDAKVLELHRNGALGLIHAHQISMRHIRKLVGWRQAREQAQAAATPLAA